MKATNKAPGPYIKKHKDGTDVKIIDYQSMNYGKEGHIDGFDPDDDMYVVRFANGNWEWYSEHQFVVQNTWMQTVKTFTVPQGYVTSIDFAHNANTYDGLYKSITKDWGKAKCRHSWKLDYKSPFVPKEYHSCSVCGAKKEEVEAAEKDTF